MILFGQKIEKKYFRLFRWLRLVLLGLLISVLVIPLTATAYIGLMTNGIRFNNRASLFKIRSISTLKLMHLRVMQSHGDKRYIQTRHHSQKVNEIFFEIFLPDTSKNLCKISQIITSAPA